jgi:hypothetical protein
MINPQTYRKRARIAENFAREMAGITTEANESGSTIPSHPSEEIITLSPIISAILLSETTEDPTIPFENSLKESLLPNNPESPTVSEFLKLLLHLQLFQRMSTNDMDNVLSIWHFVHHDLNFPRSYL